MGRSPAAPILIRARLSVPLIRLLWISFKFPAGTGVLVHVFEVTSHCWAEQDNIPVPATVPSLSLSSSPEFLTSHSLLSHHLIITVLWSFVLFWMAHPHCCCPGFFLLFPAAGHWKVLASVACGSLPVYPDFARVYLDSVTRLVSPPALCLHHRDFIPATHFCFEEHLCCSHISGSLLQSLTVLLLWWPPAPRGNSDTAQLHLQSHQTRSTGNTPGAELQQHLGISLPFAQPTVISQSQGCVRATVSLCPIVWCHPNTSFPSSHSLTPWSKCHTGLCALHLVVSWEEQRNVL